MIQATKIFIAAFIGLAIVYDMVAFSKVKDSEATISVVMFNWSRSKYGPILVFLMGALCYHLFIAQ